ncbi:cupin domain-containing protein [Anoxynatronum sibiricum]|uniref:Cupin domain-containing protein n=1 Tax=Anoxynatronum sibiricum TaxID=210623 RepID=A0ABU9VVX2_9CLOT
MKVMKNIDPLVAISIGKMVENSAHTIASKAICATETTDVRFFSYAKGESISKEYQEEDSLIYVYEGRLKIRFHQSDEQVVSKGELMMLPSNVPYGIEVLEDSKSLNILVK